jgi:hypothetical protein
MPLCPRCGKCLSSEQALSYHLNRKYKCHTWTCNKCDVLFNTKFQLQIHEMKCLNTDGIISIPSVNCLLKIYNHIPGVIICTDKQCIIETVSPNFCEILTGKTPRELIGQHINELNINLKHLDDTVYYIDAC